MTPTLLSISMRYFMEVAQAGSVHQAAARLFVLSLEGRALSAPAQAFVQQLAQAIGAGARRRLGRARIKAAT